MVAWIWVLIPLVAIVGGLLLEFQKNKMKMMNRSRQNEEGVEDLRKLVTSLKSRIENLEAIAAGDPNELSTGTGKGMKEIEIEEESSIHAENRDEVSNIAKQRRKQR